LRSPVTPDIRQLISFMSEHEVFSNTHDCDWLETIAITKGCIQAYRA